MLSQRVEQLRGRAKAASSCKYSWVGTCQANDAWMSHGMIMVLMFHPSSHRCLASPPSGPDKAPGPLWPDALAHTACIRCTQCSSQASLELSCLQGLSLIMALMMQGPSIPSTCACHLSWLQLEPQAVTHCCCTALCRSCGSKPSVVSSLA